MDPTDLGEAASSSHPSRGCPHRERDSEQRRPPFYASSHLPLRVMNVFSRAFPLACGTGSFLPPARFSGRAPRSVTPVDLRPRESSLQVRHLLATCCSFSASACRFALHVYGEASFLKPHGPTSAGFKLLFCRFLTSRLSQNRRVGALLWTRLWLQGMSWLVRSSVQTTEALSTSGIRPFGFLLVRVFTENHSLEWHF